MTLPRGYQFAATYAGIRKQRALDLALMMSETPASAAAVFTQNMVRAAPVTLSARNLKKSGGLCRAIIVNAGNANCATPTMGKVARNTVQGVAKAVGAPSQQVLVASTGAESRHLRK